MDRYLHEVEADLALKIQKAKQGNSNLASQIVNSPGRLKEEVAQARQRLESLQELKCQLQLRHQELMQYSEELKQTKAILGTFNENMNCIATELDKERELEMKLKEIRTLNKRLQRQLREGQTQNDDHQEQLSSRRERLAAVDLQLATKTMALQQKLKTVLREAEIVEQFQTECDIATSVIEQETEQLNKEIKEVTQQADEADADISGQLCEVLSAVDEFNQRSTAELLALESRLIARNKRAEELIKKLEMLDVDADDFVIDFVV